MSCYEINLKQLRNCGISLNDKTKYKEEFYCFMGGPVDITDIYKCENGISMWAMLDRVCYNYSEKNAWNSICYLSCKKIFKDIKNPLLTDQYYKEIEHKLIKINKDCK